MSLKTIMLILKVAVLLDKMPMGEGWFSAANMRQYSGVSLSTIHRYLKKLEAQGYLHFEIYNCRKITCKRYRVTETGKNLYESQWEISF